MKKKWKIWGSPWSAAFCSMAFNVPRGDASVELYSKVPDDIDILISHGPPFGLLDKTRNGNKHVGCDKLLLRTQEIQPRMHVWVIYTKIEESSLVLPLLVLPLVRLLVVLVRRAENHQLFLLMLLMRELL